MKKIITSTILLSVGLLSACSSKTDANEKNFSAAMSAYFNKNGDLCLGVRQWPVDLRERDIQAKNLNLKQMSALESVGLVKAENAEVDIIGIMSNKPTGEKAKVKRYTLSEAANPFVKEIEVKSIGLNGSQEIKQHDLCWGQKALDKIVKWEGPIKLGDYQEAGITYTYKINNMAEWANNPEVQSAFPSIQNTVENASTKQLTHGIKLTSEGWEARGLD